MFLLISDQLFAASGEKREKSWLQQKKKKNFMRIPYEDMWSPYEKCQEIVRREWGEQ